MEKYIERFDFILGVQAPPLLYKEAINKVKKLKENVADGYFLYVLSIYM